MSRLAFLETDWQRRPTSRAGWRNPGLACRRLQPASANFSRSVPCRRGSRFIPTLPSMSGLILFVEFELCHRPFHSVLRGGCADLEGPRHARQRKTRPISGPGLGNNHTCCLSKLLHVAVGRLAVKSAGGAESPHVHAGVHILRQRRRMAVSEADAENARMVGGRTGRPPVGGRQQV